MTISLEASATAQTAVVRPTRQRVLLPACVAAATILILYLGLLLPGYPGKGIFLVAFSSMAIAFAITAIALRPSYFVITFAALLTLGFPVKLLLHRVVGIPFVEPVGSFDASPEQWDMAIIYSTVGLAGCLMATVIASRLRSPRPRSLVIDRTAMRRLRILCAVVAIGAIGAYGLNAAFDVLRIGYPSKLVLPWIGPPLLSFVITWGAVLAALGLTWWLAAAGRIHRAALVYVATAVGLPAAITMGSRVQLLLYVFAAVLCLLNLPGRQAVRNVLNPKVALAAVLSTLIIGATLIAVNFQRDVDFAPKPENLGSSLASSSEQPAVDEGHEARVQRVVVAIANLVTMRWLGLEGTMAMAGTDEELGIDLFVRGLVESPAAGMNGIYQHIAGDPYAGVEHFSFLTIPGLIGFASLSGNLLLIGLFSLLMVLAAHMIEVTGSRLIGNDGVNAVVGVSLAYLLMQLNFPWTILAYAIELLAALIVITLVRFWIISRPRSG